MPFCWRCAESLKTPHKMRIFFQVAKVKQIFRVQCTRDDQGKPLVQVEREARRCGVNPRRDSGPNDLDSGWFSQNPQDDPPRRVKSTLSKQTLYCSFCWHVVILCLLIAVFWILLVGLVCDLHIHRHHRPQQRDASMDEFERKLLETMANARYRDKLRRPFAVFVKTTCFCLLKQGKSKKRSEFLRVWTFWQLPVFRKKPSQFDECHTPGQACKDKSMKRCQHFVGLQVIRLVAHEMPPAWDVFPS